MRIVRGITIAAVAILLGLFMAAYRPWRSGANHGEGGSTGGSSVAQNNSSQATGAQGAQQPVQGSNQPTEKVQQPATGVKQQGAATQGAKRQAKIVKRSTARMRRAVRWEGEGCECPVVETQRVKQVVIGVIQPTEYDEEETTTYAEPWSKTTVTKVTGYWPATQTYVEPWSKTTVTKVTGYWPATQTVNITVPESQECPTPYHEVWVEFPDQ